MHLMQNWRRTV